MGKNARRASLSAQQRIACAEAECPTTHIEGKLFVNATVLTLTPTKGSRIETRYTLKDGKLELRQPKTNVVLSTLTKKVPATGSTDSVLKSLGLSKLNVELPADEIEKQAKAHPGTVSFEDALRAGLQSFLTEDGGESPIGLLENIDEDDPCYDTDEKKMVKCLIDDPSVTLGMLKEGESAEQGENVSDNGIFTLSMPNLSDHGHWAIVDRSGKEAAYNYGFN